ncbi:hypothetical protein GEU84_008305 [Fertoebacter nigrum]|uniref:Lipoprotein n=1 Tax=Fertoeibacter niger TaxID=2656921 RepID=A0A8X8GWF5_9RHOB|nr:hypothetical protein [Fertoeibacter niger]NUB44382.1 hypothetical protein [Fertoeibacter niger]
MTRAAILLLALLAACGPVSRETAEAQCFERARLAQQPRGMIGIGGGTYGLGAKGEITITSDYLMGRDPAALYDSCVFQRSGEPPSQPLYTRPDWKR